MSRRMELAVCLAMLAFTSAVWAQRPTPGFTGPGARFTLIEPPSMSGPRVGLIYFANGITRLEENDVRRPSSDLMSIFGWQFEDQAFQMSNGLSGMTEFVVSVAGIDQHLLLPAASLLMALRSRSGLEAAIGPTLSPTELNLTFAAGRSVKVDGVRIPLNVALVASATGPRVSITTGWIIDR